MNVLLAVPWDNAGGVSRVVNNIALELRARGHGVALLLPGRPTAAPELSEEGFPIYRLNLRPTSVQRRPARSRLAFLTTIPGTIVKLARLLRRLEIDIVNVHYPNTGMAEIAILGRLRLVRLITSIHGAEMLPSVPDVAIGKRTVRWLCRASEVIVAPSNGYADAVCAAWASVDRARIEVIPNGVDPVELSASSGSAQDRRNDRYILSIITLVQYKGGDVLIRAFARVASEFPDVSLRMVSDGPQRGEYEALSSELGLSRRITFLGALGRRKIAEQLRNCELFVLPSRTHSESFGIALAEAMSVDRPVIGSRVGGVPELIDDGETGLLVPSDDVIALATALHRLLGDEALRTRLGAAGGRKVRSQFLWRFTRERYLRLYERVLRET